MEIRLNLVLLGALAIIWATLSATEPAAAIHPDDPTRHDLAELEDRFARDRTDVVAARRLATQYLEIDRPGLAIATLRSASPELLDDPMLAHRLAQAYEMTGRVLDAHATARLALARCARSLGTAGSSSATPLPRYGCSEREYAALDRHLVALDHMVRWGVAEPRGDHRTQLAYDIALRQVRVARVQP